MTDLDEREESFDALLIAAGLRLRADMARAAVPLLRRRPRSHRRRWVIAMAAVVAVIVGLIAVGARRNEQSVGSDPSSPRWILTDLPDGWDIAGVSGPNPAALTTVTPMRWVLYSTDAAPLGPIVAIVPDDFTDVADPSTARHVEVGGKRAVIATSRGIGQSWIDVELTPGHWVGMVASGLNENALLALGGELSLGSDDLPTLTAPLPLGLRLVGSGDVFAATPITQDSVGTANSWYRSGNPRESWSMSVGPSSDLVWTWWGLLGARPLAESGMFALDTSDSTQRGIVWERDGLAFNLEPGTGAGADEAAMVRAAESARPATTEEWSALTRQSAGAAPAETVAASTETSLADQPGDSWTDVHVETSVGQVDDFSYRLTFTVRGSTPSSIDVSFLGRSIDCGSLVTGITGGASAGRGTVCVVASPDAPKPAALRIYGLDGIRYLVDMQTLNGVTFAVYHIDGIDTPHAEVVNSDGTTVSYF